jgi:flavin-dependent dehydrogenase
VLVNPQIFSVKTLDIENNIERFYQRFYVNMDRKKFDKFLISLIPKSVKIESNSFCKKILKDNDFFEVEYEKN